MPSLGVHRRSEKGSEEVQTVHDAAQAPRCACCPCNRAAQRVRPDERLHNWQRQGGRQCRYGTLRALARRRCARVVTVLEAWSARGPDYPWRWGA